MEFAIANQRTVGIVAPLEVKSLIVFNQRRFSMNRPRSSIVTERDHASSAGVFPVHGFDG